MTERTIRTMKYCQ